MSVNPKQGRQPVRAASLDRAFAMHDMDVGQKVALVLTEYHRKNIGTPPERPTIEDRLRVLEAPWYLRWLVHRRIVREIHDEREAEAAKEAAVREAMQQAAPERAGEDAGSRIEIAKP